MLTTPRESPEPTTAERVRTICARAAVAQVAGAAAKADDVPPVPCPVHHLLEDGTFALSVDRRSPLAHPRAAGAAAVVELLDRVAQPADAAVRALVWIRGRVRPADGEQARRVADAVAVDHPHPALLDIGHRDALLLMTVESIVFADAGGAATVDHAAVLAADPDPFCHKESAWVNHLQQHHPEMVERLRLHLPRRRRQGRIRLLGLDRYGLTVKTEGPQGDWESRVPFLAPAADDQALSRALRSLMACPFGNGLRPRIGG